MKRQDSASTTSSSNQAQRQETSSGNQDQRQEASNENVETRSDAYSNSYHGGAYYPPPNYGGYYYEDDYDDHDAGRSSADNDRRLHDTAPFAGRYVTLQPECCGRERNELLPVWQ